jgi:flagellar biosynthesis chaperone FliJ
MTIRPRAARNVRDLRTRLRDIAAASHANTVAARERSREALEAERRALDEHLDTAQHELLEARSVFDVETFEEDTGVHRIAIADAAKQFDQDTTQTQLSEAALRERARQLRSSEKLVERLELGIAQREASAEQRANDDISARTRR